MDQEQVAAFQFHTSESLEWSMETADLFVASFTAISANFSRISGEVVAWAVLTEEKH
jgi:hypothetical protein